MRTIVMADTGGRKIFAADADLVLVLRSRRQVRMSANGAGKTWVGRRRRHRLRPSALDALEPRRLPAGLASDLSFGAGGRALADFSQGSDYAFDATLTADGKVV